MERLRGTWHCLNCYKYGHSEAKSWCIFFQMAIECPAGHIDKTDKLAVICIECDEDILLRITERKQKCFQQGCGRLLAVNRKAVEKRLEARGKHALLAEYYSFFT
jgi:hypothetical protein